MTKKLHNLERPIRKQREVLYLPEKGHSAVLGTAGSGKTTLALYRAAYLSDPSVAHHGRVLLLTFNRALLAYLNHLKSSAFRQIKIETYHTFARGYLKSQGLMRYNCICSKPEERQRYIVQARRTVKSRYEPSSFFQRPIEFFTEEIKWIFDSGIESEEAYRKAKRVGRIGTKLERKLRPVMFEILKEYVNVREQNDKLYDWDDIALYVRKAFDKDESDRIYKHIIIDEGQDFSPEMIRSLVAAVPKDGSLTFFGDVAQQIYGQKTSWRAANLKISKQWTFEENYRNTQQISQLGLAIANMPFFSDIPDLVMPTSPPAAGPLPTLVKCKSDRTQIDKVRKTAEDIAENATVAILTRTRDQERSLNLKDAISIDRDLNEWLNEPGIYSGTYYSAKGLEFNTVILPFLEENILPSKETTEAHGEDEAMTQAGRMLYVAVTRAQTNLILLYNEKLTPLLPRDPSLYQRVQL